MEALGATHLDPAGAERGCTSVCLHVPLCSVESLI